MNPWINLPDDAVIAHLTATPGTNDISLVMEEVEGLRLLHWFEIENTPRFRAVGLPDRNGKSTYVILVRDYLISMVMHYKPELIVPEGETMQ